jgi:hypothetical protein
MREALRMGSSPLRRSTIKPLRSAHVALSVNTRYIEQAGLSPAFLMPYYVRINVNFAFRVMYAQGDCYRR